LSSFARGVGVAPGTRHEHVAPIQGALECLEHAEAVGAAVKLTVAELRIGEHQALPLAVDQLQRNGRRGHAPRAAFEATQRVQGVKDGLAGGGRFERHDVEQRGQEAPQARVAAQQLAAERGILAAAVKLGRREARDGVAGGRELAAADASRDRRPQRVDAARWRVEQHEHRGAQLPRGAVELESSWSTTWSKSTSASSVASSSSCHSAASSVASRRLALIRRSVCAFAIKP